jgi:hypothetical protein
LKAATVKIRDTDHDRPHFVARGSELGYTSNPSQAMRGEPEAVRPEVLEELQHRRDIQRQAAVRRRQEWDSRQP